MTKAVVHELVTVTADEAGRLEEEFLNGLDQAQDAFVRIMETNAWAALGHDSFVAWWERRVVPVMRALSMRPTPEIAAMVVERVRQQEADLPPAQRRRQGEIGQLVGVSEATVGRIAGTRSTTATPDAVLDLDLPEPPDQPEWTLAEEPEPSLSGGDGSAATEAAGAATSAAGESFAVPAVIDAIERQRARTDDIRQHNDWARQVNAGISPETRAELDDLGRRIDPIVALTMACESLLAQVDGIDPERAVREAPDRLRHKLSVAEEALTYLARVVDELRRQEVRA